MSKQVELNLDQQQLVAAWQRTLPTVLNPGDQAKVEADEADERCLRITIHTAGHTMYSFDFKVEYVDSREVKASLVDAERKNRTVNEQQDIVQQLVQDYIRHIHECAQALHAVTHA